MSVVSRSRATAIIPEGWTDARLRFLCLFNPSKSEVIKLPPDTEISFIPMEYISTDGVFNLSEKKRLDAVCVGFTYFRNDDIIVAKITPCFENGKGGLAQGLTNSIGFGTTEFHVLRATKLEGRYLAYLCRSHPFRTIGKTEMFGAAGQKRVPEAYLKDEFWPIPPRPQQTTIADFLDRETARIDVLIAKEEHLLALLEEKRTALISHAVTRGIDPNVELKESGMEWIGQIPKDWEVKKLKYCSSLIAEKPLDAQHLPYVGLENVEAWTGRHIKETDQKPESVANLFEIGDVLFGKLRPYLAKVLMPNFKGRCTGELLVLRPRKYDTRFLQYLLLADNFINNVDASTYGAKMPRAEWDFIGNLKPPLPPHPQQTTIADFLDQETTRIDALKTKINRAIELLREKRTALISAAVTGKIKI